MKVLVTGGAGSIGTALVEKLSYLPEISGITVYDNLAATTTDFFFHSQMDKSKVKFVKGDILETRKIQKYVKEADTVVHLASLHLKSEDNTAAHHMEQVNHWGTAELTYAIENASIKKLVFVSAAEVYGFSEETKTEKSDPAPSTSFAVSKWRGEAHVSRLASKLESTIFRPGIVAGFGPVKKIQGVANQFLFDMLAKNKLSIYGNGKQVRPFVSLPYVVNSLLASVSGNIPSGMYNLTEANLQILDVLEALKKIQPNVEFVFNNHHLQLPSLSVSTEHADALPPSQFDLEELYRNTLKNIIN